MNAITLKEAQLKLQQIVELLPLDEYNSWKETIYLLSSPANAEHLRKSIAEAEGSPARE